MELPAISVIIPMYNAEKYVSECLDSLLAQTFRDFEVIVVDDCSTDNCVDIVQNFEEKFGGRLKIISTKKNSGNAGYTARNKGFRFSRGEYVFFVDADDFITKNALEELYTAAKSYDADVVYTGARYLYSSAEGVKLNLDGIGLQLKESNLEDKPKLMTADPHENLQILLSGGFFWTPWTKFVKRNFLTDNEIVFYEILSGGDHLWIFELLICSGRLLRIPEAFYFWRNDSFDSMTRKKLPVDKQITTWIKAFVSFARVVVIMSKKWDLLKENPDYCYLVLRNHFDYFFGRNIEARFQVSSKEVYEILRREFENAEEFALLIPFLFSFIDNQQKNLLINQQQSTQYVEQTQERIAELEKLDKLNKAYISELENFVLNSQERIAELENERPLNDKE